MLKKRCEHVDKWRHVRLQVVADFVRPEVEGDYSAGFIVSGAYLPTVREYMEVQVIDAHQGLRQF
jgi:hypothetical protein